MATINAVNTSLSGQSGTGAFVGDNSPSLIAPDIGAATATSLEFADYSTGGIIGTSTNDNAATGYVGEVVSAQVLFANRIGLTNTIVANVTSISLTAGDWDVGGMVHFGMSVGANSLFCGVSTTSATLGDRSVTPGTTPSGATVVNWGGTIPMTRLSLASTTTVYLVAQATFGSGTAEACGFIIARRRR